MKKKKWIWLFPGLILSCLLLVLFSFLSNQIFPDYSPEIDSIPDIDKLRLMETQHLRDAIGNLVFPGWTDAPKAQILYNEENVFLINLPEPKLGWLKIPQDSKNGIAWQITDSNETWNGMPYYRQPYADGKSPEAFAVRIGDQFVGSLPTFDWMRIGLMQQIQADIPDFLQRIIPFPLISKIFFPNSDTYLSLIQHENFHAYQATWAKERFYLAETASVLKKNQYPWDSEQTQELWQMELAALEEALRSEEPVETEKIVEQFLSIRRNRRTVINLPLDLIDYENQREWVEGMARYVELESWRLANTIESYRFDDSMQSDPYFKQYRSFSNRWNRELDQMKRMYDDEGDGRFYYSGMAQAYLLDRLSPGWKDRLFNDPTLNLEILLSQAVGFEMSGAQ